MSSQPGPAAGLGPVATTLVAGGSAARREAAIAAMLAPGVASAIILEGMPDGSVDLAEAPGAPLVVRIAPGCMCCAGNLVLRVHLNRILRRPPERLFLGLATDTHLTELRAWLTAPPYAALLALDDGVVLAA